jgi:hypothetical protein
VHEAVVGGDDRPVASARKQDAGDADAGREVERRQFGRGRVTVCSLVIMLTWTRERLTRTWPAASTVAKASVGRSRVPPTR